MSSVLEFKNISKYFPGVKALDNICFKAYGGEVLAFLGENGAGKSTLLKVLNGDYQPTNGEYLLDGVQKHFSSPHEAIQEGISVIYQERQILLELSVAENIYLGRMPSKKFGIIDKSKANQMAQKIIDDFGLPISPTTKVKDLSIAYQQMVEIMKAYSRENLKVICFDEPTASLSDAEIDSLFEVIAKLKAQGKIIIYVSHRMKEIQQIADKVAIFKDGHYVDTVITKEVPEQQLIKMMVGRDLGDIFKNLDRNDKIGDVLLEVKGVSSDYVKENSFVLHKGEVLGFSGLVGAGRTELMRAIIGADKMKTGEVYLEGKKIVNRSPKEAMDNGIVLVPEDRKLQGILSNLSIAGNINIALMDKNSNKLGVIDKKKEAEEADWGIRDFKVKTPSPDKKIVELSGGNQQKVILGRWLMTEPDFLILDEPTRGIDVGTKTEIQKLVVKLANEGMSVVFISSEVEEMLRTVTHMGILRDGEKVGELEESELSQENVMKAIAGGDK